MKSLNLGIASLILICAAATPALAQTIQVPFIRDNPNPWKRHHIELTVVDCLQIADVDLVQLTRDAWREWKRSSPIPTRLIVREGSCSPGEPARIDNNRSELYWINDADKLLGQYLHSFSPVGALRIVEDDIWVNLFAILERAKLLGITLEQAVYAVIAHELGHVLGLGDAYTLPGNWDECGWSIMLRICTYPFFPTQMDIEALRRVWESTPRDDSERPYERVEVYDGAGRLVERDGRCTEAPQHRVEEIFGYSRLATGLYIIRARDCYTGGVRIRLVYYQNPLRAQR